MDIKHRGAFEPMDVNDYSVDSFEGALGTKNTGNQQQLTIQGFHNNQYQAAILSITNGSRLVFSIQQIDFV